MNRVFIAGNVGKDADKRETSGGTLVATLSVATNERKKGENGVWVDHTEWHRVVAFGPFAKYLGRARKGQPIVIEGRLQTRRWQDKEGNQHYTTEIVAESAIFDAAAEQPKAVSTGADEDIPF